VIAGGAGRSVRRRDLDRLVATIAASLLLVSSVLSGGCSLFFVHGPTEVAPGRYTACTTNHAAPVVDSLVAGLQVARTLIALDQDDQDYAGMALTRDADIGIGVGLAAAFAASAVYGYSSVARCREITGPVVSPRPRAPARPTRVDRRAEEAAEEAAVQARLKEKAAAEAKAAGEADGAAPEQKDDAADAP
jgi:hypothetical protein